MKLNEYLNYGNFPDYSGQNQLQQLQNQMAANQHAAQLQSAAQGSYSYDQLLAQVNMANAGFHKEGVLPSEPKRLFETCPESQLYERLAIEMKKESGHVKSYSGQTTIKEIERELQYRKNDAKVKQEKKEMLYNGPIGPVEIKVGQIWKSNVNNHYEIVGLSDTKCSFTLVKSDNTSSKLGSIFTDISFGGLIENYTLVNKQKENKMKEILKDLGQFLKEHRTVIYTVALIALVDHFILGGKFRDKLKELAEKALTKAHKQLDDKIGQ